MSRALALVLAIVVLAILLATPHADTQAQDQVDVKINWIRYINPTDGYDGTTGTCVFSGYIAVVGEVEEVREAIERHPYVSKPYVALLRRSDGSVVREWIDSEKGAFVNCISIGGKLYAIGYTRVAYEFYGVIYVFDENLNILARARSESPSVYLSLAYDGKALYIGGWAPEDVDGDGRREEVGFVEKRVLDESPILASSKKIYFRSWIEGRIYDIGVDPSTGRIWAVGYYKDSIRKDHSLIVILDGDLRELKVIDHPAGINGYLGSLYGIAFDDRYAYVTGELGVAKFSLDGELVAINKDGKERTKIVYGYNYLYTFGDVEIGGYWRHVLYIHGINLNLVKSHVLSKNVDADSYFYVGRPALEGNNIYVAGIDFTLGSENSRIVVYSLSIEGVTVTTETGAEATTATIAVSDRALTQLIAAGLAAAGIVLTIALLLLRRRR